MDASIGKVRNERVSSRNERVSSRNERVALAFDLHFDGRIFFLRNGFAWSGKRSHTPWEYFALTHGPPAAI